jgi:hypothetical protein
MSAEVHETPLDAIHEIPANPAAILFNHPGQPFLEIFQDHVLQK